LRTDLSGIKQTYDKPAWRNRASGPGIWSDYFSNADQLSSGIEAKLEGTGSVIGKTNELNAETLKVLDQVHAALSSQE
jgi:hypothetical protein